MTDMPAQPNGIAPTPTAEEATAIVAALETFVRATAPAVDAPVQALDHWRGTAILEGVAREPRADVPHPWINT